MTSQALNRPVDVLGDLRGLVRIAKAASIGVTGNAPRIERAEQAIENIAKLMDAAKSAMPFVVSDVLEHCDGNKCREPWCAGCMGEDEAERSVEQARDASSKLYAALTSLGAWGGK